MDLSNLSNLVLYLFLISALTEKITEGVKLAISLDEKSPKWKKTFFKVVTIASAGFGAYAVPPEGIFVLGKLPEYVAIGVVAILGSSGSGVWHDMIQTMFYYKESQKTLSKK